MARERPQGWKAQIHTDLRDGAQNQADQLSDVEIGRSRMDGRFFPMNLTSFQDRLQRQPPARLVFAHGQQDAVQGLAKLQGLESGAALWEADRAVATEGNVLSGLPGDQQEWMFSLARQMPTPSAWLREGHRLLHRDHKMQSNYLCTSCVQFAAL